MIAVIYQFSVKPGYEEQYKQHWQLIAGYFAEHRGAIGSTLHSNDDGKWVVYSRWPDRETWQASWPGDNAPADVLPDTIGQAIVRMRECVYEELTQAELVVDVAHDYLSR